MISLRRSAASAGPVAVHRALIDAVFDLYATWRQEEYAVTSAYDAWRKAAEEERATRFAAYVAALDREERAGSAYAELSDRMGRMLDGLRGGRRWALPSH
jgi:hypothetical protein